MLVPFYAIFFPADPIFALNFAGTFLITNIAMGMFQNGFLTKCQAAFEVRPLLFSCLFLLLFFFLFGGGGEESSIWVKQGHTFILMVMNTYNFPVIVLFFLSFIMNFMIGKVFV